MITSEELTSNPEALRDFAKVQWSREDYQAHVLGNLTRVSRTARGIVDTNASADKAEKMAADLTAQTAAERAHQNVKEAVALAYDNKDHEINTAKEVRDLIEKLARTVNKDITKSDVLYRSGAESPKHFSRIADLEPAMQQFSQELIERLQDPKSNPIDNAAFAEYRIDLRDHFFADGCAKTSKVVSAWVLMRAGLRIPDYPDRLEYYKHAPKERKSIDTPSATDPDLREFTNFYRTLFLNT